MSNLLHTAGQILVGNFIARRNRCDNKSDSLFVFTLTSMCYFWFNLLDNWNSSHKFSWRQKKIITLILFFFFISIYPSDSQQSVGGTILKITLMWLPRPVFGDANILLSISSCLLRPPRKKIAVKSFSHGHNRMTQVGFQQQPHRSQIRRFWPLDHAADFILRKKRNAVVFFSK